MSLLTVEIAQQKMTVEEQPIQIDVVLERTPVTAVLGYGDTGVDGPASSTDHAVARWDGTTGELLQDSLATLSDAGTLNLPTGQTYNINGTPHTHAAGDVAGPASSTDHAIARFAGATGKIIQDSLATVSDAGGINLPSGQTYDINGTPHTHADAVAAGRRLRILAGVLDVMDTHRLYVDAAGYGDYTTIQGALDYIAANPANFTIIIRNGTYAERLVIPNAVITVTLIADGNVTIAPALSTGENNSTAIALLNYATLIMRDITVEPTGSPSNGWGLFGRTNGGRAYCYNCTLVPKSNTRLFLGSASFDFHNCTIGSSSVTYTYAWFPGQGTTTMRVYNSRILAGGVTAGAVVDVGTGQSIYLYHSIVTNGGATYDLRRSGSTLSVLRCAYNRAATSGTITVMNGDLPALSTAGAYTVTNVVDDRAFDTGTVTLAELAQVVGTLINDLKANNLIS